MKTNIGMWIDQRKAVIILSTDMGEETKVILSNVDRQPGRIDGERSTARFESLLVDANDVTERRDTSHLHRYYDEVIACVREAEAILVFGPGEAKGQLLRQLEDALPKGYIVAVETADKMTDRQVAARVRDYFKKESPTLELG